MKTLMILLGLVTAMKAETPAHFTAIGRITRLTQLENGTTTTEVINTTIINQDLTKAAPGFMNRWVLQVPYAQLAPTKGWFWVTAMADGQGNEWLMFPGWGMVQLTPCDAEVWKQIKTATAFETRWQMVTISEHSILIEEPIHRKAQSSEYSR